MKRTDRNDETREEFFFFYISLISVNAYPRPFVGIIIPRTRLNCRMSIIRRTWPHGRKGDDSGACVRNILRYYMTTRTKRITRSPSERAIFFPSLSARRYSRRKIACNESWRLADLVSDHVSAVLNHSISVVAWREIRQEMLRRL